MLPGLGVYALTPDRPSTETAFRVNGLGFGFKVGVEKQL